VAANGVDLGDHRDVCADFERLDRGAHAGQTGADHDHVVLRVHHSDATQSRARVAAARLLQHELVGEDAPVEVVLVVPHARRNKVDQARVGERHPRSLIHDRPVELGPE
jgi:hypothetical protein